MSLFRVAKRCQLRLAAVFHRGLLNSNLICLPGNVQDGNSINMPSLVLPTDTVCNSVIYKSTEYKINMIVVLEVQSQDTLSVGWLKKIVIRDNKLFFLVYKKTCVRDHMRFFQSIRETSNLQLVPYRMLKSYKPLIPRGTEISFVFFLAWKLVDDEIP